MGKINEISQKVEQSFKNNKYTTEIKDDVVEFDSNGLMFNFVDPVNVPSLRINGEEIVKSEPQVQSDWAETDGTAVRFILNRPAVRAGGGTDSIVEGDIVQNTATGNYSHAEGYSTKASDYASHAEGYSTKASSTYSHAEGYSTKASGTSSHAEGYYTTASGYASHAEGNTTTASGSNSHAEGSYTTASGPASHAEGADTKASSTYSHAEGSNTTASGYASHAEGNATTANHKSQHVYGEYNIPDPSINLSFDRGNYVEIVGNGEDIVSRSNARTLDWAGNEVLAGTITANGVNISEAISTVKFRVSETNIQASIDGGTTWHTLTFAD